MIKYKNKILLCTLKIKFFTNIKLVKLFNGKLIKFTTKKIIANRAPKHFNIGQHAMKVRQYKGEQVIPINYSLKTFTPQCIFHNFFYEEITLAKKLSIRSSTIYYSTYFKFKQYVILYKNIKYTFHSNSF